MVSHVSKGGKEKAAWEGQHVEIESYVHKDMNYGLNSFKGVM